MAVSYDTALSDPMVLPGRMRGPYLSNGTHVSLQTLVTGEGMHSLRASAFSTDLTLDSFLRIPPNTEASWKEHSR